MQAPDSTLKKSLLVTTVLVHYTYLSTMLLNGVLFLLLPASEPSPFADHRWVFSGFLGISVITFPLAWWLHKTLLGEERLRRRYHLSGLVAAATAFKGASVLIACIGDLTGICGATYFVYSREANGLLWFLIGWAAHYGINTWWLARGKGVLKKLAVPLAASAPEPSLRVVRRT